MVFSSAVFLSLYLPFFLVLYFLLRSVKYKNVVLVISSLVFYAWGEPVWVILLLFSGCMDYVNGRVIEAYRGQWQAKAALTLSIVINLGILSLFKYSGFVVENINALLGMSIASPRFNLPIGISFYTFQTLTYTIDAYRGKFKAQKSLLGYLTYLTMFPPLVAGPIVRYLDVREQINRRTITQKMVSEGITRFAVGLGKKVILANSVGEAASTLLDSNLNFLSGSGAWLGIVFFAFQIYFDFSGYSDMAIGLGKMLGFTLPENFNYPYISKSVTEFWRRWHMSLGTFFRDYVYIPLGGNRRFMLRNLAIVWFLTGLWHGASWNFILWGIYYLLLLVLEKIFLGSLLERLPGIFGIIYNIAAVLFGWMLFYFTDFARLGDFFRASMFQNGATDVLTTSVFTGRIFLIVVCIIGCTPIPRRIAESLRGFRLITPIFSAALLIISFMLVMAQTFSPFLYFAF